MTIIYRIKINALKYEMVQNKVYFGQYFSAFYSVNIIFIIGVDFGLLMSCNYKSLMKYTFDDKFLTLLGAFGALACGLSRFLWAALI